MKRTSLLYLKSACILLKFENLFWIISVYLLCENIFFYASWNKRRVQNANRSPSFSSACLSESGESELKNCLPPERSGRRHLLRFHHGWALARIVMRQCTHWLPALRRFRYRVGSTNMLLYIYTIQLSATGLIQNFAYRWLYKLIEGPRERRETREEK